MLYFDRIEVSEGIDVNKTNESKECDICHYCCFLNKGFEFQSNLCNGSHDLVMMSTNLGDIGIFNTKGTDYRCIISGISKYEANFNPKYRFGRKKQSIIRHRFYNHMKMGEKILTFGDIEIEKKKNLPP